MTAASLPTTGRGPLAAEIAHVRAQYPALGRRVHGKPLVYLDNAATTQRPLAVLDAVREQAMWHNANVHRGVHLLSQEATERYEAARHTVRTFLGAADDREIVFVRGTTEALNLAAATLAATRLGPGRDVLLTGMEHHSNIVPWQLACQSSGASLRVVPILDDGSLDMEAFDRLLDEGVAVMAIIHTSNALGTVNPVQAMCAKARAVGALSVVDGAQAVPHGPVDVQALGADLFAFSGHKVYGPTGIGALYGRAELLEALPPWQGGGDMIRTVSFEGSTWADPPARFEAGTPNITGAVGLAAAIDHVTALGLERIAAHEADLLAYATARLLADVPGVRLIGTAPVKAGVLSFTLDGVHPHDIGTVLDYEGIAIRTGHHCAQPVMDRFGVPATARASFGLYTTREEVDALVVGLHRVREMLG
ncbi:MAG: SufS family cysteine desulfurase [Planctomycetota bacterium]